MQLARCRGVQCWPALLGAVCAAIVMCSSPASAETVEICHIPPGEPGNFHTIRVGKKALEKSKHLVAKVDGGHGDKLGPCNANCAELCDDNNACTIDDTGDCEGGCPTARDPVDCNDSNACTADSCEPATGCEHVALNGTSCTVTNPGTCQEGTGVCDTAGACEPDRTPDCCLSTAECQAWDTDLCTNEECVDTECVTTSEVVCETDACNVSVCIPQTGQCTEDEPVVCPNPECHVNGCHPETGCFSNVIDGCCISDDECNDYNNCTTDTCLGEDGCTNVECASGDACNVLVDCDPFTCEPETLPQTCDDDGDLCTAESCVDGLGCVSDPVVCTDDGDLCTVETCFEGACISNPVVCDDDGNLCTVEACEEGACVSTAVECPLGAACDPSTGDCVSLCYPAPEGLAGWWTFDTDATDIQSSRNGVLRNGATAGAIGIVGGALSLDGVDDYVDVPDSAALSTPTGITVDAWIQESTGGVNAVIASKYNSIVSQVSWYLGTNTGGSGISFSVYDEDINWYGVKTTSAVLTAGVWHHVAATFDVETSEAHIYVDGVQVDTAPDDGSQTLVAIAETDVPVQVGAATSFSAGGPSGFWPGLIDELEIFDRALAPAEVAGIYNAGAEGKCTDNLPDPPCFSIIPEFGSGGGTAAVDMCIYECDARGQCPTSPIDICNLKDDPGFLEAVEACLSGVSFNACVQVDAYGWENGCDNICPLPQGENDLLVCGDGGCNRHNSDTGALAEEFTLPDGGCGDTVNRILFNGGSDSNSSADDTFWMYNIRNALSQPRSELCVYDDAQTIVNNFDLPEPCDDSGCTFDQLSQRPAFAIVDWLVTPQGTVYASANGTCRGLSNTVCTGAQTYMWRIDPESAFETPATGVDPECGARPYTMVADTSVSTERAHVVAGVGSQQRLIRMELGTATPGCTAVSILTDALNPTALRHALGISRLRVDSGGAHYFLAALGNISTGARDEGIWRVPAGGGAPEQVLAMCDVDNPTPGGVCTTGGTNKPITDFAIHPTNGNLYVLETSQTPGVARKIQVYDISQPTPVSLGVLREFTEVRGTIEFFPN